MIVLRSNLYWLFILIVFSQLFKELNFLAYADCGLMVVGVCCLNKYIYLIVKPETIQTWFAQLNKLTHNPKWRHLNY